MRIDTVYCPWLACANDGTRPALECVWIERLPEESQPCKDGPNGVAVAADGYMLAVVPVHLDPGEEDCLVPKAAFHPARVEPWRAMRLGGAEQPEIVLDEVRVAKATSAPFPRWRAISECFAQGVKDVPETAFDLRRLGFLSRAIGAGDIIRLQWVGTDKPILVQGVKRSFAYPLRAPYGLLMPCSLRQERE